MLKEGRDLEVEQATMAVRNGGEEATDEQEEEEEEEAAAEEVYVAIERWCVCIYAKKNRKKGNTREQRELSGSFFRGERACECVRWICNVCRSEQRDERANERERRLRWAKLVDVGVAGGYVLSGSTVGGMGRGVEVVGAEGVVGWLATHHRD